MIEQFIIIIIINSTKLEHYEDNYICTRKPSLYPIHAIKAWNYFMYIFHIPNIPKLQQQFIVWPCLVQAKFDCLFPKKYIQKCLHHINKWSRRILKLIVENLSMEWEIKLHINTLKLTIAPISTSNGSPHNHFEFFHYLAGRLFVKFKFFPIHKVFNNWIFSSWWNWVLIYLLVCRLNSIINFKYQRNNNCLVRAKNLVDNPRHCLAKFLAKQL